ncbi:MAG: PA14 domain-containing protein [Acidobacteriota bacterium]
MMPLDDGTPVVRARTRRPIAIVIVLLTSTVVLTAALVYAHQRLLARSGLTAEYRDGATWDGAPRLRTTDDEIAVALVRRRAQELGGAPFTVTWTGYVIVPVRGVYRFALFADDRASLEIDRRLVVEVERTRRESSFELGRGLHPVRIRYADIGGRQGFELLWALGDATPTGVPRLLLVPQLVDAGDARRHRVVSIAAEGLPLAWSVLLIASIAALIARRCLSGDAANRDLDRWMLLILIAAGVAFSLGVWWGLPDYKGWAPDELTPGEVADYLERWFSGEWATTYPPLHYAVVALFSAPVYAAGSLGLVDLNGLDGYTQRFLVGRMISVAMALGVVALVYRLTRDEIGRRAARFAATVMATALPLTYYARTTNLDVPYLFWLVLSFVLYLRAGRTGDAVSYCLFALTGAAAIATKDQAYGFYVLPAAYLAGGALVYARGTKPPPGIPTLPVLCAMAAVFIAAMLIFYNVPLNPAGVREHLRLITGPGSEPYRMYPRTPGGHARMLVDAIGQLAHAMSWPMFAIGVWATAQAIHARITAVRRLWLPAVSYYVTFIAAIMYPYDRFFLGICVPLAIAAGWWLDRWTRRGAPLRALRVALVALAVAYAGARVAALDAITILDSRYYVERWLVARAGPETIIAAEGPSLYLPRPARVLWARVGQDLNALETLHPDFLVVNPGYSQRGLGDQGRNEFYDALDDGRAHYRRVLRYRTWLSYSPLRWEPRFNGLAEDPFSNVTKVNPLIDVYERVR